MNLQSMQDFFPSSYLRLECLLSSLHDVYFTSAQFSSDTIPYEALPNPY